MASSTDRALKESLLAFGRDPTLQTTPIVATVGPSYASPGYAVDNVSRVAVVCALGREGGYRRSVLTIGTFDAASTYAITVGGITSTSATPATRAAALTALVAGLAGLPSTYTVSTTTTELTIVGPSGVVSWTATAGAPVLGLLTEYTEARLRLYSRLDASAYGSRISDADDLVTAQAWTLHFACGEPCDYSVSLDGLHLDALPCGTASSLRPWLTDLAAPVDVCTPGAITYRDPVALVLPCILGAS